MALKPGTQIGPYEITAPIGSGGMGEVYRATDTKLKREVAIKVLPEDVAGDSERLARFEREAHVLASLNHPHIASIYGLEESGGVPCLVLELVEGQTLAERLGAGALPVGRALEIAEQIASALEAAHEKGVIHRDLKPANVKITPEGSVKVLDFGLAKAFGGESAEISGDPSQSPTLTAATRTGMILGTAVYMSPEQARGKRVDKRTDIWALGCVIYELLTGHQPFAGDSITDVLAAVVKDEPDWTRIPPDTPPPIWRLLRRCLVKDPRRRLRDMGDARIEIDDVLSRRVSSLDVAVAGGSSRRPRSWLLSAVGWVLSLALGVTLGITIRDRPWSPDREGMAETGRLGEPVQVTWTSAFEGYSSWSADGRTLAFHASESRGDATDVWVVQMGSGDPINRTSDHSGNDRFPTWAPDGQRIAFWSDRGEAGIHVMPALRGAPRLVAKSPIADRPQWSSDGQRLAYIFRESSTSTLRILTLSTGDIEIHQLPADEAAWDLSWSHDGRLIAYVDGAGRTYDTTRLRVVHLNSDASFSVDTPRGRVVSPNWSPDGRKLYFVSGSRAAGGDIWVQRFGPDGPKGSPHLLTRGRTIATAAVSPDGQRFAYSTGRQISNLWRFPIVADHVSSWKDAEQLTFDEAESAWPGIGRNGRTVVFRSNRDRGKVDLWKLDISENRIERLTDDEALDFAPRVSNRGDEVVFYSTRTGNRDVWLIPMNGGEAKQVTQDPANDMLPDWSSDDRRIVFQSSRGGRDNLWVHDLDTNEERQLTFDGGGCPAWSPTDDVVAFGCDEGLCRIAAAGGDVELLIKTSSICPTWSPDGSKIYHVERKESRTTVWEVDVRSRQTTPVARLDNRPGRIPAISTDGRYVLFEWKRDSGDLWVADLEGGEYASVPND